MMEICIQMKAFNPRLEGKAVKVVGYDANGEKYNHVFLVSEVDGEKIILIAFTGKKFYFHIADFDGEDGLIISLLEEGE